MAIAGQYRNQIDLINETLARIGVLVAGQTADVEDFNRVQESVDSTFRKLNDLEICDIPDENNIPGQWFNDLADILAGEVATKFGKTDQEYMMLINKGLGGLQGVDVGQGAAAKSLRQMRRGRPTGETLVSQYF